MNTCVKPIRLYLPRSRKITATPIPSDSTPSAPLIIPAGPPPALIQFRPYQCEAFQNRTHGIDTWLWGRQTGKSFTLAAWAVDRLITNPGRTVTVFSNSKSNGMEFNRTCAEVCALISQAFEQVDLSVDKRFENMRAETRIAINGKVGRILICAPNPLTARCFTGDLILDEFAFQERSAEVWNAAEPIISSNPGFLCRIASTPNGKHNQFYRMMADPLIVVRKVTRTDAHDQGCLVYHPRTREPIAPAEARELAQNKRAYDQNYECVFEDESMALLTYDLIASAERPNVGVICDRQWSSAAITLIESQSAPASASPQPVVPLPGGPDLSTVAPLPAGPEKKSVEEWLAGAADEAAMFRRILMNVCNGSADRIEILAQTRDPFSLDEVYSPYYAYNALCKRTEARDYTRQLFVGIDVGRHNDRTVVTVLERIGHLHVVRAILRLAGMRLPEQQERIERVLSLPNVRHALIDETGLGLGLFEFIHRQYPAKITGINFASTVPAAWMASFSTAASSPPVHSSVRVTEFLAIQLLQAYENHAIQHPADPSLRDHLRKPERFISASGRVSIAATRNETGHADHFWSLALALAAAQTKVNAPLRWWAPATTRRRVAGI